MSRTLLSILTLFLIINNLVFANKLGQFLEESPKKRYSSPININSKTAKPVNISSALTLGLGATSLIYVFNSGKSIEGGPIRRPSFFLTGGILGKELYLHGYGRYFFNRTGGRCNHAVDGIGNPVELNVYYYNIKYGTLKAALKHRDGVVVLVRRIHIGPFNVLFVPLQLSFAFGLLKYPGSILPLNSLVETGWLDPVTFATGYYIYSGTYVDPTSGEKYAVTYIVVDPDPLFISETQFQTSFPNTLSSDGTPLETTEDLHDDEDRTVWRVYGDIFEVLTPF